MAVLRNMNSVNVFAIAPKGQQAVFQPQTSQNGAVRLRANVSYPDGRNADGTTRWSSTCVTFWDERDPKTGAVTFAAASALAKAGSGVRIYVEECSLHHDSYVVTNQQTGVQETRYTDELRINRFHFIDAEKNSWLYPQRQAAAPAQAYAAPQAPAQQAPAAPAYAAPQAPAQQAPAAPAYAAPQAPVYTAPAAPAQQAPAAPTFTAVDPALNAFGFDGQ